MTKTTAPDKTPSPKGGDKEPTVDPEQVTFARTQFLSAVLNLSWQLAAVVLVPLLLGSYLDSQLDFYPILTIVGFVIAMGGVTMVVWRQMQDLDPTKPKRGKKA